MSPISVFAADLKKMSTGFETAQRQATVLGENEVFPEGEYVGKVTAKLKKSQAGNLMVGRMFIPLAGDLLGQPCYDNIVIGHPDPMVAVRGQRRLIAFLDMVGMRFNLKRPESEEDGLEPCLEALSKAAPIVKFKVSHGRNERNPDRPFINVDVLELVNAESSGVKDDISSAATEAETPRSGGEEANMSEDELMVSLAEFCNAQGVSYDDQTATLDSLKQTIADNGPYTAEQLTKAEKELLTSAGLEDCITTKAPIGRGALPPSKHGKGKKR